MPIYEYTCRKCGAAFEHLARTLQDGATACPVCGADAPRKQFSSFAPQAAAPVPAAPACGGCPGRSGCPSAGGGCCGL